MPLLGIHGFGTWIVEKGEVTRKVCFVITLSDAFKNGSIYLLTLPQHLLNLVVLGF
jgi:hypothetical protein